jgi:hypothetical protein
MYKTIEIEEADFQSKLAISAILDTDSGHFYLALCEGRSLSSYKDWGNEEDRSWKNGVVELFEDNRETPILRLEQAFQITRGGSRYAYWSEIEFGVHIKDIPTKTGSKYRLEVNIEDYEKVTATTIMPPNPDVKIIELDTINTIIKRNMVNINSLVGNSGGWYSNAFHTVKVNIEDHSDNRRYYAASFDLTSDSRYFYNSGLRINVDNMTLIQDNPDVEAQGILSDGESYDMYTFDRMLFSNLTFANYSTNINLYIDAYTLTNQKYKIPEDIYDPEIHGKELLVSTTYYLILKSLTTEAFKLHRSMALQREGLGFFSEPAIMQSNVTNGFGFFTACNTQRIELAKNYTYEYYFPEQEYTYSSERTNTKE